MEKITLENFKEKVMQSRKPVILEFHGSFCPGCDAIEAVLNEAQSKYGGKILFGIVDADHEEMMNTALHVYNLPVLFFFQNGHLISRHDGFMTIDQLDSMIHQLLDYTVSDIC